MKFYTNNAKYSLLTWPNWTVQLVEYILRQLRIVTQEGLVEVSLRGEYDYWNYFWKSSMTLDPEARTLPQDFRNQSHLSRILGPFLEQFSSHLGPALLQETFWWYHDQVLLNERCLCYLCWNITKCFSSKSSLVGVHGDKGDWSNPRKIFVKIDFLAKRNKNVLFYIWLSISLKTKEQI